MDSDLSQKKIINNIFRLWYFWLSILIIVASVITYKLTEGNPDYSPFREVFVIGSVALFIFVSAFKMFK